MRKPTLWITAACTVFVTTVLIIACKKSESRSTADKGIAGQVSAWLNSQKLSSNAIDNEKISTLINSLDMSGLRYEELNTNKKFVVIPLKKAFSTGHPQNDNGINILLLKMHKEGNIEKGYIVQYSPKASAGNNLLPQNCFYKMFRSEIPEADGHFLFLNLNQNKAFEYTYKNGDLVEYSRTKPQLKTTAVNSPPQDPIGPPSICTDWYWVTTTLYADGHTETSSVFAFTTCVSGSGGGGEGNQNECCEGDGDMTLSSDADPVKSGFDCAPEATDPVTGNPTKQCTMQWHCNTNRFLIYTWKYLSIENSNLEKISGIWLFKTTTHSSYSLDGQLPPCVTFSSSVTNTVIQINTPKTSSFVQLDINNSFDINCIPFYSATTNNVRVSINYGVDG